MVIERLSFGGEGEGETRDEAKVARRPPTAGGGTMDEEQPKDGSAGT